MVIGSYWRTWSGCAIISLPPSGHGGRVLRPPYASEVGQKGSSCEAESQKIRQDPNKEVLKQTKSPKRKNVDVKKGHQNKGLFCLMLLLCCASSCNAFSSQCSPGTFGTVQGVGVHNGTLAAHYKRPKQVLASPIHPFLRTGRWACPGRWVGRRRFRIIIRRYRFLGKLKRTRLLCHLRSCRAPCIGTMCLTCSRTFLFCLPLIVLLRPALLEW